MIVSVTGPVLRLAEKGSHLGRAMLRGSSAGRRDGRASLGYRLHGDDGSMTILGARIEPTDEEAFRHRGRGFIRDHWTTI